MSYCFCKEGGKLKYPFHEAAYVGDVKKLEELFKEEYLESRDCGGNTPLLIAIKAQRVEAIKFLLSKGANPLAEDSQGWNSEYFLPLIKDKECLKLLVENILDQKTNNQKEKFKQLGQAIRGIPNGFLEIEVHFTTWIPFISSLIPSSRITIRKQENMMRLDFEVFGNNSFTIIFIGNEDLCEVYRLEPDSKRYFNLYEFTNEQYKGKTTDEMVAEIVKSPAFGCSLETKNIAVKPETNFFGRKKTEKVSKMWDSDCYEIENMKLVLFQQQQDQEPFPPAPQSRTTQQQQQNPSSSTTTPLPQLENGKKDNSSVEKSKTENAFIKKNVKLAFRRDEVFLYPIIKGGRLEATIRCSSEVKCTTSLIPISECENKNPKMIEIKSEKIPARCEYEVISPESGVIQLKFESNTLTTVEMDYSISNSPEDLTMETLFSIGTGCMSRVLAYKPIRGIVKMSKTFKAKVSISNSFPYTIEEIIPMLTVLDAGGDEYSQISSFFKTKLPKGFPVKAKIPLFLSFSLEYNFNFAKKQEIDPSVFVVPSDYTYHNPMLDVPIQQQIQLDSTQSVVVTAMIDCNVNPPNIHDVIVFDSEGRQIEMNVEDLKKKGLEDAITHKLEEVKKENDKKNNNKMKKNEENKEDDDIPKNDEEPRVEIIEDDVGDEDDDIKT